MSAIRAWNSAYGSVWLRSSLPFAHYIERISNGRGLRAAWVALSDLDPTSRDGAHVLVGRSGELERILRLVAEAARHGAALMIFGDLGVGKSALLTGADMYSFAGGGTVRMSARPSSDLAACPDLDEASGAELRGWLDRTWRDPSFAAAVELASPALATQVQGLLAAAHPCPRAVRRAAISLLRYRLHSPTRATPFGLSPASPRCMSATRRTFVSATLTAPSRG